MSEAASREWRVFLLSIIVVPLVFCFMSLFPGTQDDHVRYAGVVLQLFGIFSVAYGLSGRRRLFNRPGPIDHLIKWLTKVRRSWWRTKSVTVFAAGTTAQVQAISGSISVSYTAHDMTIEARLTAMEANIETLRSSQAKMSNEFHKAEREWAEAINEAIGSERQSRELAIVKIRATVDKLGAESLHIETAGLIWLTLGVVMGTIPEKVAMWLQMIP